MKIVCDTNVLISAFVFPGGPPDRVFRAMIAERFQNITSPDLLTEVDRVMAIKFKFDTVKRQEFIHFLTNVSEVVYPSIRIDVIKNDRDDNRVLECAVQGMASAIVTGDKRSLLPMKTFKDILIISPADFCFRFKVI